MIDFKKHKFKIQWIAFIILVGLFIFFALYFEDKQWISNALQTIGTITGIYLTIIVFFQSKDGADKQSREHIKNLQDLNTKHIDALYSATEKQIETLQSTNEKKIKALIEGTDKQIKSYQELTEKQIETLNQTTNEQISSFKKEINEVTVRLADNSILLSEILGHELEKSINLYGNTIKKERRKYENLTKWTPFRTKKERE